MGGQTDRNDETDTRFSLVKKNAFKHTDYTTLHYTTLHYTTLHYLHKDFIFTVHNSYSFRTYIQVIFREFQLWSTCAVFMAICLQTVVVVDDVNDGDDVDVVVVVVVVGGGGGGGGSGGGCCCSCGCCCCCW